MNLEERQIEALLGCLLPIDKSIDALIVRMEDRSPAEEFQQLKDFSKHIKIALTEALNYESDYPFDKVNLLPLIDMADHAADSVEAGDMDGQAVVRAYRKSQSEAMTDIEECVRAAEFIKNAICA